MNEKRLRSILENSSDHIMLIGQDLKILFTNKAVPGFEKDVIIGKNIIDLTPYEFHELVNDKFQSVFKSGEPTNYQTKYQISAGATNYFDVRLSPVTSEGKVVSVVFCSNNITEQILAQQAIQQERDRAQIYLDIAEVMIMSLNKEGEITLINRKCADILGYRVEELIGENWFDTFLPEANRKQAKKSFRLFVTSNPGTRDRFEQTILTRCLGERIIDWHHTSIWGEENHTIGLFCSGEDITERKQAEKELKNLKALYHNLTETS